VEIKEIIRTKTLPHTGYMPQSVSTSKLTTVALVDMNFRALQHIPRKITAYFDRDKMQSVYKSDCFSRLENYYLILSTDGTLFHVDY